MSIEKIRRPEGKDLIKQYSEYDSPKKDPMNIEEIRSSGGKELIGKCRKYLNDSPEEKYLTEIIERLLIEEVNDLMTNLNSYEDINKITGRLYGLNEDLEKYEPAEPRLLEIINLEEIKELMEKYLDFEEKSEKPKEITINNVVRVKGTASGIWDPNYQTERNINFPMDSTGTVIDFQNEKLVIDFGKKVKTKWSNKWSDLTGYWKKKDHQAIAFFKPEELDVCYPYQKIKVRELEIHFKKFLENYEKINLKNISNLCLQCYKNDEVEKFKNFFSNIKNIKNQKEMLRKLMDLDSENKEISSWLDQNYSKLIKDVGLE